MKELILYISNPVSIVAIFFLLGLFSSKFKNRLKYYSIALSIFIITSTPIFSFILSYPLVHTVKTVKDNEISITKSVIVLSAGIQRDALGNWVPGIDSVNRTLVGKDYSEKLSVPLIISGGKTKENADPEAVVIKNHFNLVNAIVDLKSTTTYESSKNLSKYCEKNIGPYLIITGEYHRLRSYLSFKSHKCDVLLLEKNSNLSYKLFMPSIYGMSLFKNLIYEYVGLIYYLVSNKIKILVLFDI